MITPGGEGTYHLIDAEVLNALGPNGYLINVARGSVVDEAALIEALQKGVIAGAGLDVFEKEPHVPEALKALDNVVLTPHMASATRQTRQAMADLAIDNLRAHFAGRPLDQPGARMDLRQAAIADAGFSMEFEGFNDHMITTHGFTIDRSSTHLYRRQAI